MVITERQAAKKKLMAATSMLLVACIMMISATYAWFTLSTAPEITGITTAVGANGNLEIALADKSTWVDPDNKVSSAVGTSMSSKVATEANITWGNLVDLSDAAYGLNGVTLLPSALNLQASDGDSGYIVSQGAPLSTPAYGADGRVSELEQKTSFAQYSQTANKYAIVSEVDDKGVRVIGKVSGLSDRALYYRNAKLNLSNAISQAKVAAKASLEDNGEALANMVMSYALDKSTTYGADEIKVVGNMITSLSSAQAKMVTAWENAVIAYAASSKGAVLADDIYLKVAAAIQAGSYSVSDGTMTVAGTTVPMDETFITYYNGINNIKTEINAAKTKYDAISGSSSVTWAQLSNVLSNLVNTDELTVCGITTEGISNKIDEVVSAYTSTGKLTVEVPSGSGVYSEIADYCGDYSASVTIKEVSYGSISLKNIPAIMTTESNVSPAYFTAASTLITSAGAPSGEGGSSGSLSDFYGYATDFYVRTNAAGSNLLLQVDAAQRVYSESESEVTQGSGSNMEFTVGTSDYTLAQMVELMKAIRVVFTDGNGTILAMARLDLSNYTGESAATPGKTVKADLKLCDFTVTSNKETGKITYEVGAIKSNQIITSLSQNTAQKLSAMVYLDGDEVTNAMVANGQTSMTGKMNLQFASDANLVPMEDSDLRNMKKTSTEANK